MSRIDRQPVSQVLWTWLMTLHTLTAGASSPEEAEARVDLVAAMLAQRFGDDVFTDDSLEHVARRCRFWPVYAELVDGLREFARTYLPRPLALPAPREESRPPPDAAELRHIRGAIEGFIHDPAAARVEREAAQPGPVLRPLPDVTAKGEALERIRASGRVVAKAGAAPDAAAEGRSRDDRRADAARRRPASRAGRRAGA